MENATPTGRKFSREVPPASVFRNVSYQRATHESMMGDSVVNQSPVDGATATTTVAVNNLPENDRLTVENSEVEHQLLICTFGRCKFC